MSKRDRQAAAAAAASEAGRVLQAQRSQAQEPEVSEQSLEPQTEAQDRPLPAPRDEPRMKALEEIWERDRSTKSENMALPAIGEEPPAAKEPAAQAPEPVPPTPEQMLGGGKFSEAETVAETPEAVPEPEQAPTIEYVRVKVDGEEFDAPKAEVEEAGGIKAYQRDKAAENRLQRANETLAEAKRIQAQMAQMTQRPAEPVISNDEFIAQRLDAIRYGTPAEAAKALTEIQQRSAPPQVDQQAVIQQAVTQMNYLGAVKQFTSEFKDLTQDPDLMMIIEKKAANGIGQLPQDKSMVDWTEFYRKIGNEVRLKFNRPNQPQTEVTGKTTGHTSQVSPDKEARKASIVNLPTAAARAEVPKESKPETRADTLAEMRRSRGIQG